MRQPSRLGAAACAAALAVAVAGCGSSKSSGSSSGSSGSSSSGGSVSGKGVKVVYIPGLTGNPFYSTVACGAAAEAKQLGASFSTQGAPTFAVNAQTPVVEAVTARKPSAIMISNDDPKAMIPPLLRAQAEGIKIINIDGDLAEKKIGVTNIQSDDITGGQLAAKAMGKLTGGKGDILVLDNEPGITVSQQRRDGFTQVVQKQFPGLTVLPVQYTNNETSTAASDVRSTEAAHHNLAGVYSVETNNTQGAVTAIRELKMSGKLKLVGYDTSQPIVQGIEQGIVSADIVQYPYGEGMLGLKSAVEAVKGKSVPREQSKPFVIATQKNVHTPKVQKFIYKTSCSS